MVALCSGRRLVYVSVSLLLFGRREASVQTMCLPEASSSLLFYTRNRLR
ncbi:hypothetical protein CGRA01v4_00957 [Colletotrichum graminicola]|nr:hypothetical protein CGRA01v4_00957 [Colletotrichum graminicola]